MPPKTARLQEEVEAQRARAAALQYLAKTGAGPSQKEIAQQQKDRAKWTNSTSQAIQDRLAKVVSAQSSTSNAPTHDNTLEILAAYRAKQMLHQPRGEEATTESYGAIMSGSSVETNTSSALANEWKEARDPVSGDVYYWNEITKETSWDRPTAVKDTSAQAKSEEPDEELEEGWEAVDDPQSGSTYYWNRDSNETTWTKPIKKTVSLEQAREAKSKLDAILNSIGGASTTSKKRPASTTADANDEDTVAASKTRKLE